ncbi:MAG: CBS domain-containing protein [Candidatus Omnitrophota bacterium]
MERISNIPLRSVMVVNPVTISVDAPFSKVEELLRSHRIRHLPVIDHKKMLCGMITQTDLYRTVSPMRSLEGELFYTKDLLDNYILKSAMTKEVTTLAPQDNLASAVDIMVKKRYGCIPIVNEKCRLEGIITQIDVLKVISKYVGWVI